MAETEEKLNIVITADTKQAETGLSKVASSAKKAQSTAGMMQSSFKGMAAVAGKFAGVLGVAIGTKALVDFGKSCVDVASDLQEVQNVLDVTFGDKAAGVDAWAKNAATQFGLSELAAKQFAGTMGAMLKSMNIQGDVSGMSMELAGLAADMASFYNLDAGDAFDKIRAGIAGNTQGLKTLGINLSAANLEEFRLAQGIKTSYTAMSEAEKAMLRYQYLMQATGDAQGDFSRTSGSWANQVRILSLQFDQLKGTLGTAFLTVLTPAIQMINALMAKIVALANVFGAFVSKITGSNPFSGISSAAASATSAVAGVGGAMGDVADETKKAGKAAKGSLASFDKLNNISTPSSGGSSGGGGGGGGGGAFAEAMDLSDAEVTPPDTSAFEKAFAKIKQIIEPCLKPIQDFCNIVKSALLWCWDNVIVPIATFAINEVLPRYFEYLGNVMTIINEVLVALAPIWQWFWDTVLVPIATFVGDAFLFFLDSLNEGLSIIADDFQYLPEAFEMMKEDFLVGWDAICGGFNIMKENFKTGWDAIIKFFQAAWAAIKKAFEPMVPFFKAIWDTIKTVFSVVKEVLCSFFSAAWEGIKAIWSVVTAWFKAIWESIKAIFSVVKSVLTGNFQDAWNGIKAIVSTWAQFFQTVWDAIKQIFSAVAGFFSSTWTAAWNGIKSICGTWASYFTTLWGQIKNVFSSVGSFFKSCWQQAYTSLTQIFGNITTFFNGIWGKIRTTFSNLGTSIGNAISGSVKTAINGIIRSIESTINSGIRLINSAITIINKIPGVSISKISTLDLPRLARGGIVDNPGAGVPAIIGEAGREVVLPLERNTGWMDTLAAKISPSNSAEELRLMREQNQLLRALLNKDLSISTKEVFNAVLTENQANIRRTGVSAFA